MFGSSFARYVDAPKQRISEEMRRLTKGSVCWERGKRRLECQLRLGGLLPTEDTLLLRTSFVVALRVVGRTFEKPQKEDRMFRPRDLRDTDQFICNLHGLEYSRHLTRVHEQDERRRQLD